MASLAVIAALATPLAARAEAPVPAPALFFGMTWVDTSAEGSMNGERPDQTQRLHKTEDQIAEAFRARGFAVTTVTDADRPAVQDTSDCNGCDTKLARQKGATYAITGRVQKVSNLIISLTLFVRDADSRKTVAAGSVDLRGNTDESWSRGARYLLDNIIFKKASKT